MGKTRPRVAALVLAAGAAAPLAPGAAARRPLDVADPVRRLEAYVRADGDTSGRQPVTYGHGTVYGFVPGEILERRHDPYAGREVDAVPIENDAVNRRFTAATTTFKVSETGDERRARGRATR